ncbi:MAG: T9SS type A sorting domain-containing protein [Ignavibacterium sp.]|nr:MAG: T9SS type A sorting domain-containing protein [Ignavibacterium sp.]
MKIFKIIITIIFYSLIVNTTLATEVNGRILLLSQDHVHYSVKLQLNSGIKNTKLGGATFIINYDSNLVNFPSEPILGVDYLFNNFTGGFYDTATVTKVFNNQIWINISLDSDENGTPLEGSGNWTDLVTIRFGKLSSIVSDIIIWKSESIYWKVYNADNTTTLQIGNFNNSIITSNYDEKSTSVDKFQLSQNYPNPFNPYTSIKYSIASEGYIKLVVYNMIGEEVTVLVDGQIEAGFYEVSFNGSNLSSGTYFYKLQADSFIETKKMVLLR